jgi:MraZ protein
LTEWGQVVNFPITSQLSGTRSMLLLTGEYEHSIDEKGRLFISNKLRGQIDAVEYGSDFYLVPGPHGILYLYPQKCFETMAMRSAADAEMPDDAIAYERMNFGLASKVELDKQGRLLITEKMRRRSGLGSELTLVGVKDHIEVWNSSSWEEYVAEHHGNFQQQVMKTRQDVMKEATKQGF